GGASAATGMSAVVFNNGVQAGNGAALICFASPTYSVGGTATGQTGAVTLQLSATNPVSTQQVVVAQAATSFVFPTRLPNAANWTASVLAAPPGQICTVNPSTGTILGADVQNIALNCETVAVTIAPTALPDPVYNTAYSQSLSASSANGGTAPYTFSLASGALPSGLALSSAGALSGTPTTAGSNTFEVQATSSNGFSGSRSYTVTVAKLAQSIGAFAANPAAPVFAPGGTFTVSATGGGSGNPVVFASTTPAVCTVAGSTVTMQSAGNCALTADQAGNANYDPAPQASLSVTIAAATQAISNFAANPASPTYALGGTFAISATPGPSTSPVVFGSLTTAVCTVSGSTVTMQTAGNCALTADQAGDANYEPAPQVSLNVTIAAATQAITNFAANPASPTYSPGGTFSVSATPGLSSSPVVFGSLTTAVCTVSGGTVTMLNSGVCSLTADQAADINYEAAPQVRLDVTIQSAAQTITGFAANPAAPVYTPNGTFALSASGGSSGNPVVFASTTPAICTISGNTATMQAAGTCALTANQAGGNGYLPAAEVELNVAIGLATPTLGWIAPLVKTIGESGFDLPDPTSPSSGSFTFTSSNTAVATVSGRRVTLIGNGVTTLVATQAASGNYTQATVSTTLTVDARPDPTRDPSVVGGIQAQVDASVRFAAAQQANIRDRLRQQRHARDNRSSNGLSLSVGGGSGAAFSLPANQLMSEDSLALPKGWGWWTGGTVTTGERAFRGASQGFDFRSDGITAGVDWWLGGRVLVGIASGWGWNDTDFDRSRSRMDAEQRSLSVYGLWRHGDHVFVDGTFGWGRLDFDIRRVSDIAGATGLAKREGDQNFASLTVGYERANAGMSLTGYGRLDASRTRLDAYREQGLGIYDLAYGKQTVESSGLAVGLEGSYSLAQSRVRPYWMLEYREAFENRSDVALNYVVSPVATDYKLALRSYGDNMLSYGAGLDWSLAPAWNLSFLFRREHATDQQTASSFGLMLSFTPRAQTAAPASVAAIADSAPAADAAANATGR
ncbi:MAG TPA: autotransporter domain-containing protein, partial [Luteimonas sp.]|nr:autotransporter domain-containing protein [Luteimonas sp.]